ncbi:hypothetical protein MTR_5g010130 [Medicago truncatula]|uniref:Uncharacterized protein n=1 Tax=Medicago truncatula TaxID=3880 RepID=G7KC17_MEDTR|nr:hypothetical protein MTR_5g010130 [Medicago truncatula]
MQTCPHAGSNYGPPVYKTGALPLSYKVIPFNSKNERGLNLASSSIVLVAEGRGTRL